MWEKNHFFGARLTSNLVYISAKGTLRKNVESASQKWISQISTKVGPLRSAGEEIPEIFFTFNHRQKRIYWEGGGAPVFPPKTRYCL